MSRFPNGVTVVQNKDPGVTGNFEVTVDGVLVHSKKTQGEHGFLESNDKQIEVVAAAIQAALDSK
eukprot:m.199523 g.199523  ORF g.199523 m.199523 type:complete len:65 (+) comp25172_c3_seq2:172-366(+)